MGGMANTLVNDVAPMLLDPLNITGIQGGGGASSGAPQPAIPQYAPPQPSGHGSFKNKGFLESMISGPEGERLAAFSAPAGAKILPPPAPQWSYEPGKGPSWTTHERQGATNQFTATPNLPGSAGFNSYKGNRF